MQDVIDEGRDQERKADLEHLLTLALRAMHEVEQLSKYADEMHHERYLAGLSRAVVPITTLRTSNPEIDRRIKELK